MLQSTRHTILVLCLSSSSQAINANIGSTSVCNRTWGFSAFRTFQCHGHISSKEYGVAIVENFASSKVEVSRKSKPLFSNFVWLRAGCRDNLFSLHRHSSPLQLYYRHVKVKGEKESIVSCSYYSYYWENLHTSCPTNYSTWLSRIYL